MSHQDDVIKQIDNEVKSNKVLMYIKGTKEAPMCGFSAATIDLFKKLGKPFTTVDVIANPDRRMFVPQYSQWPTFPQVFIDGKLIGGCDIVHELQESGELKQLLDEAFAK